MAGNLECGESTGNSSFGRGRCPPCLLSLRGVQRISTCSVADRTGTQEPGGADRPGGSPGAGGTDFGPNQWLVDELYQRYQADPSSVDRAWWNFFADYQPQPADAAAGAAAP